MLPACQLPGLSVGKGIVPRFSQDHQEIKGGIINEVLGTEPRTRWMLGTGIVYQSLGFRSCKTPIHSLCFSLSLFLKCISSCHSACGTSVPCCFSHVQLFVTPWTVAHQAPLSIGFSRQEYQSGLSFPPPGDLSKPGIKPTSLRSPALAGSLPAEPPGKPLVVIVIFNINNSDYIFWKGNKFLLPVCSESYLPHYDTKCIKACHITSDNISIE